MPTATSRRQQATAPNPIDRLCAAINSHDPQHNADCFTVDYRAEVPHHPSDDLTGSGHVFTNWTAILTRLPNLRARVLRRATSGTEVWSEWEMTGTDAEGTTSVLAGPVMTTARSAKIDRARFYVNPVGEVPPLRLPNKRVITCSSTTPSVDHAPRRRQSSR